MMLSWDDSINDNDNAYTSVEVKFFHDNSTQKYTLYLNQVMRDLSNLQTKAQKLQYDAFGDVYSGRPPPTMLRSCGGLFFSLAYGLFKNPEMREDPDAILCTLEDDEWEDQKRTFETRGFTVNRMKSEVKHVWLNMTHSGTLNSITRFETPGATKFELKYYVVSSARHGNDFAVASLLPRLLTGDVVSDMDAQFVYVHLKEANHTPITAKMPLPTEKDKMPKAFVQYAQKIVNRPMVLDDFLVACSDAGREKSMVFPNNKFADFESISVATMKPLVSALINESKKPKKARRVNFDGATNLVSTEHGRNQLHQALCFVHPTHPSHIEPDDPCINQDSGIWAHVDLALCIAEEIHKDNMAWADKMKEVHRSNRQKIHDAHEQAAKEEQKVKDLRRKLQAIEARLARAEAAPKPYTPYIKPPASSKSAKKKDRRDKKQSKMNAIEHEVHVLPEQRAIRAEAFDIRQQLEHAEAVATKARDLAKSMTKLEKDMSAAKEAANHVVPPAPKLADFF